MWVLCKRFRECTSDPNIFCDGEHIIPHEKDEHCDKYCEFAIGKTPCLEIVLKDSSD